MVQCREQRANIAMPTEPSKPSGTVAHAVSWYVRSGPCAAKLWCSYCGGVYVCGGEWVGDGRWKESLLLGSLELKGCVRCNASIVYSDVKERD